MHGFRKTGPLAASWTYRDVTGAALGLVGRLACVTPGCDGRTFTARHMDGRTGRPAAMAGALYRLPELAAAVAAGRTVYLCQGEAEADAVAAAGAEATCGFGGPDGKWQAAYTVALRGADVVIVPGRSARGYQWAAAVGRALRGAAASVDYRQASSPAGGDVADHLADGAALADLAPCDPLAELARLHGGVDGGAHPVNVPGKGWAYSVGDVPGACPGCQVRARGVYSDAGELVAPLPHVHARVWVGYGRDRRVQFLMSREAGGRRLLIGPRDVASGEWAGRLGMPVPADRAAGDAVATAICYHLAYADEVPEVEAAPRATDRTPDGRLPVPVADGLPDGYLTTPPGLTPDRLRRAARVQLRIAAANPKLALFTGAAVAGPFAKACGLTVSPLFGAYGRLRQGKSTTLEACASVWGDPDPDYGVVLSFDNTRKGMGRLLGSLGIFPPFYDESGASDLSVHDKRQLALKHGGRRVTSTMDGLASRSTPPWAGFWFATGNGRFTDGLAAGAYAGIAARAIELEGPFTRGAAECKRLGWVSRACYGWLGPEVLAQVTVADMAELAGWARVQLGHHGGGTAGTLAEVLALAVAGALAAGAVTGLGTAAGYAALRAARAYLAAHPAEPESDADKMLAAVRDAMAADRAAWKDRGGYEDKFTARDHVAGVTGEGYVWVFAAAWHALAEAAAVDESVALSALHARGVLHVPEANRARGEWRARAPRWAGQASSYQIALSAIYPPDDDDGQGAGLDAGPGGGPLASWGPGTAGEAAQAEASPAAELPEAAPADGPGEAAAAGRKARKAARAGPCRRCGTPHEHGGDGYLCPACLAAETAGPAGGGETARRAFAAAARNRGHVTSDAQAAALAERLAELDAPDPDEAAGRLRLLDALAGDRDGPGPFTPRALVPAGDGGRRRRRDPYWTAEPPPQAWAARTDAAAWRRDDHEGPVTVLDRNAAFMSAAATVPVGLGALIHREAPADGDARGPVAPGYYLVRAWPWTEAGPGPLPAGTAAGDEVWVTAPRYGLLRELAAAGRWPDGDALDAVTADYAVRLDRWAHLCGELRRYAIEAHGRESAAYSAVKAAFGEARGLLLGSWADAAESGAMPRKTWKCKAKRADWAHAWADHSAVTMWRAADACARLGVLPVELAGVDSMTIPADGLAVVTGGDAPAVRLDPSTLAFGTWKVKGAK